MNWRFPGHLQYRLVHGLVLCLLAGGALFWWAVLQPAQARVEDSRLRAARVHGAKPLHETVRRRLALPAETTFPDALGELARVAQAAGLAFDEGSYQVARVGQGGVARYEITLPLHGAYPQLRAFLAGVAAALPMLVVENVQLQRQKVNDAALDARLRLLLLMEARP